VQIRPEPFRTIEILDPFEAQIGVVAELDILKVGEGVVFDGVELLNRARPKAPSASLTPRTPETIDFIDPP